MIRDLVRPIVLLSAFALLACRADTTGLDVLEVGDVAGLVDAVLCDTNSAKTRDEYGVIPEARLLSHYRDYALDELPPDRDRQLVFYCHSPFCSAAADAARKAVAAGYPRVAVMPAGIEGWIEAGHPVDRPEAG